VNFNVVEWDCSCNISLAGVANVFFKEISGNGVALVELSNPFYYTPKVLVDTDHLSFGPGTHCLVIDLNSECEFLCTYADFYPSKFNDISRIIFISHSFFFPSKGNHLFRESRPPL